MHAAVHAGLADILGTNAPAQSPPPLPSSPPPVPVSQLTNEVIFEELPCSVPATQLHMLG